MPNGPVSRHATAPLAGRAWRGILIGPPAWMPIHEVYRPLIVARIGGVWQATSVTILYLLPGERVPLPIDKAATLFRGRPVQLLGQLFGYPWWREQLSFRYPGLKRRRQGVSVVPGCRASTVSLGARRRASTAKVRNSWFSAALLLR